MPLNSSLSTNASFPLHSRDDFQSCYYYMRYCIDSTTGTYVVTICIVIYLAIILPVCVASLCLGYKQYRQKGPSRGTTSHSDFFTYNLVLIELIFIFGFTITFIGFHTNLNMMIMLGMNTYPIIFTAHLLFHTLTCVERHLAVVHPVTYLGLRTTYGTRIRNFTVAFVWLLCFAAIYLMYISFSMVIIIVSYCFVPTALIIMFYCSISILCTLIHPKPGEGVGGVRQRADPIKLRAFCTITLILGVLLCRFGGNLLVAVLLTSVKTGDMERCSVLMPDLIFSPPCSLVLPLLFLHKTGKLKCCQIKSEPGM